MQVHTIPHGGEDDVLAALDVPPRPLAVARPGAGDDRCPHPRPFSSDFSGCPAFQPFGFLVTDALENPLAEATTCRHLSSGQNRGGRFYARCGLGNAADRVAWHEQVGSARLEMVRSLEEEFAAFSAPHRARLAAARAAAQRTPYDAGPRERLDLQVGAYLAAMRTFLQARRARLEDAGIDLRTVLDLATEWWEAWARRRLPGEPVLALQRHTAGADDARSWLGIPAPPL